MQCYVYRSERKEGLYIYLAKAEDFDCLPSDLRQQCGTLELALEFELTPQRKLGQEKADSVLESLNTRGYHVQIPPRIVSLLGNEAPPLN